MFDHAEKHEALELLRSIHHVLHTLQETLTMTVQDLSAKADTLTQAVSDLSARVTASLPDPTVVDAIGQKLDAATAAVAAIDPAPAPVS